MTHPPRPNPEPITALLGRRVFELRRSSGWSQEELGQHIASLGLPGWGRTAVAKLENGSRKAVSVQELLALALVFGVPPVILVADPRQPGTVPVAAGLDVDPWDALAWLTGTATLDLKGGRLEYRRMTPEGSNASWLIHMSFYMAELLETLKAPAKTALRDEDDRLTGDPETIRRVTDAEHRKALTALRRILGRIQWEGSAPMPDVGERVRQRARELDVDLVNLPDAEDL